MSSLTREILRTAALPLPSLNSLRPEQIRGVACIWGGDPLDDDSTVDLGLKFGTFMGVACTWSPKACAACVRAAARRTYPAHIKQCQRCNQGESCDTRRALHRLTGEGPPMLCERWGKPIQPDEKHTTYNHSSASAAGTTVYLHADLCKRQPTRTYPTAPRTPATGTRRSCR